MPAMFYGVCLITLGCSFAATGLLLMKSSTVRSPQLPPFLRPRWLLGFCFLGILTTVVDVKVLAILPLSVVAPFAGLTIVFTLALAATGLFTEAEVLSPADLLASALILTGVTLVSMFGPRSESEPTEEQIMASFCEPLFGLFAALSLCSVLCWVCLLALTGAYYGRAVSCCPLWVSWAATSMENAPVVTTAASAYCAAVCGALSQLFVKVVAVTLQTSEGDFFSQNSPWRQAPPYLALSGLVVTAPLQLYLLDTALTGSDVTYAVPVYQALLILLTTAFGGIFFDEFASMQPESFAIFCVGVGVATAGLTILSRQPQTPPPLLTSHSKGSHAIPEVPTSHRRTVSTIRESVLLPGIGASVGFALLDVRQQQRGASNTTRSNSVDVGCLLLYGSSQKVSTPSRRRIKSEASSSFSTVMI